MSRSPLFFLLAVLSLFSPLFSAPQLMAMPKETGQAAAPTVTGKVVATMNAAGYTYMLVDAGGNKSWVAIPATTVKEGAEVTYYQGMVMQQFTSKTLNRTFDNLIFSAGLVGDAPPAAAGQPAAGDSFAAAVNAEKGAKPEEPAMGVSGGSAGAIAPLENISTTKAEGDNGYTVGEIYAKAKELAGKKIRVHGKVVKFSPQIMGRNWLHLQDGTGDPMHNTHDLVVTTSETAKVGDTVTIEGTLAADKDFGAGYKYAALVEDATIIQ